MIASQVLSRGQIKRLVFGLNIAALELVKSATNIPIVLLVDDLESELDYPTISLVQKKLLEIGAQLFATDIAKNIPSDLKGKDFKLFHVEHGIITPLKNG